MMPDFRTRPPPPPPPPTATYPLYNSSRRKPRRWPLVLRFSKGAVHGQIVVPVTLHCLFTALVVYLDRLSSGSLGLPSSLVPSLSIVVGLMLVFRNSTSYERFWSGRNAMTACTTAVRNLARAFLAVARDKERRQAAALAPAEEAALERALRILVALLYAIKHNLRAEWNMAADLARSPSFPFGSTASTTRTTPTPSFSPPRRPSLPNADPFTPSHHDDDAANNPEYTPLLPPAFRGLEDRGLPLPVQLAVHLESYIASLQHSSSSSSPPQIQPPVAAYLHTQLAALTAAFGTMETIHTTPIPVAHLIHHRQVLALYCAVLPFATVDEWGFGSVWLVGVVAFTLYGVEAIGGLLEDPFGYDRVDVKMDGLVEDARVEVGVLVREWEERGAVGGTF